MSESTQTTTPSTSRPALAWPERPTAAQRMGAQQAVNRLFETLAPQKPPAKREEPLADVQRHRSPTGCILQGAERAVTISWFADSVHDVTIGELRMITWRGQVARPGAPRQPGQGATSEREFALTPVEGGAGRGWLWQDHTGATYDTAALAARCHELLVDEPEPAAAKPTKAAKAKAAK